MSIVKFGTGNQEVGMCDQEGIMGLYIQPSKEIHEIGESISHLDKQLDIDKYENRKDHVLLFFTKRESIDVIIDALQNIKDSMDENDIIDVNNINNELKRIIEGNT